MDPWLCTATVSGKSSSAWRKWAKVVFKIMASFTCTLQDIASDFVQFVIPSVFGVSSSLCLFVCKCLFLFHSKCCNFVVLCVWPFPLLWSLLPWCVVSKPSTFASVYCCLSTLYFFASIYAAYASTSNYRQDAFPLSWSTRCPKYTSYTEAQNNQRRHTSQG